MLEGGEILFQFIRNNLLELFALVISLISLALSLHSKLKEKIKIDIEYEPNETFSFGFIHYDKYKLVFSYINIVNLSKTSVSINKIYLKDSDGNTFFSSDYSISDLYNPNGITLYSRDNSNRGNMYNLKSENILNNPRLDSYGKLSGYAVFFDVEPIHNPTSFTIFVETSNKLFSKNIIVSPLPVDIKPYHELS